MSKPYSEKQLTYSRTYQRSHPERVRAAVRAYQRVHPEKHLASNRVWNAAHPEKQRAYSRASYQTHRDRVRDDQKAHSEARNATNHNRRARIAGNGGSFTSREWETLKVQYGFRCPSCGKKEPDIKLTVDHIIPLSRGGVNEIVNIQPLCGKCNCEKGTKSLSFNPYNN